MTAELTSEQIVTNILLSNQILKPLRGYSNLSSVTLSSYMDDSDSEELNSNIENKSRYSFITKEANWGF